MLAHSKKIMQILHTVSEVREYISKSKGDHLQVGFVPTMGALHDGHLSLVAASKQTNDLTVCSIFVNPTQFDQQEDFAKYPKLPEKDTQLLEEAGCDMLFAPPESEMYPHGTADLSISMSFGTLETRMEGRHRTGHFNGVGIVVSKLFNIVQPDRAYFGQKDLQQYLIIRKMAEDLSFGVEVVRCPIIREKDGLAMSSRNLRLSDQERKEAPALYQVLLKVRALLLEGSTMESSLEMGRKHLAANHPAFELEYLEAGDARALSPVEGLEGKHGVALCIAAHLGSVRLIDNLIIE
jgi:pantoate--beta-alanine ligase